MIKPKIGIMYAPGTNCHEETAFAVELEGGTAVPVLLADLCTGRAGLDGLQGLIFPGGFSYGDHLAAGRVYAVQLMTHLGNDLRAFVTKGRPILGICNGDQVLMETGLLPGGTLGHRDGALAQNRSARFEGRWVRLAPAGDSFWTAGLSDGTLRLPSAHGEGRLVLAGAKAKPAFFYTNGRGERTEGYPWNPSGSPGGIAGITDESGLILGMMPHPERAVLKAHGSEDGRRIFANLLRFLV